VRRGWFLLLLAGCVAPTAPPPPPATTTPSPKAKRSPPDAPLAGKLREIKEARKAARERHAEAALRLTEAHGALDRGDYEQAVEGHRRATALRDESKRFLERERALAVEIVRDIALELESGDIESRERAVPKLLILGASAAGAVDAELDRAGPEARARMETILPLLRRIGEDGLLRQWATGARASTEYSTTRWSAMQATGAPDTKQAGDCESAWASKDADAGIEWLEVTFDHAVKVGQVRVRETFNPGAVTKVELLDAEGRWRTFWEGADPVQEAIGWLEAKGVGIATQAVRITLDSGRVAGWNEIDAVELVGEPE